LAQADGLHDSRNVRLHTRGFRNIKVHPLRSCARRGDRPEWGSEILPSGRHLKRGNLGDLKGSGLGPL
jgi:hypothetical protein